MMSYFNPERALGAPQREGEPCRWDANISVMLEKGEGREEGRMEEEEGGDLVSLLGYEKAYMGENISQRV